MGNEKELTPIEQASKLFVEFYAEIPAETVRFTNISDLAKKLALIAVNKIIEAEKHLGYFRISNVMKPHSPIETDSGGLGGLDAIERKRSYWQEVKEELQKI